MAKAVNQNDLIDIIKAQVESLSDIMAVVFKAADSKKMNLQGDISKRMEDFQEKINAVFGEKGILHVISNIKLDNIKPIGWKEKRALKGTVKGIRSIINGVVWNALLIFPRAGLFLKYFEIILKLLSGFLVEYQKTFEVISRMKIKDLITLPIKTKLLRWNVKHVAKLIRGINAGIGSIMIIPTIFINMKYGAIIISMYSFILQTIKDTPRFLLRGKINALRKLIRPLNRLLWSLNRLGRGRIGRKTLIRLMMVNAIFSFLKKIVITLVILAPLMMLMTILSPLLILGFLALILLFKVFNLLMKLISKKSILMLTVLALLFIVLCVMAVSLIVLGLLAVVLIEMLPQIALFFVGLIVVIIMMAAVGWIISGMTPLLVPFIAAVLAITIMITMLWVIAAMLEGIGKMDLNVKVIKEKIKTIVECIFSIAAALFESSYEAGGASSEDGVFKKIFSGIIGFFATWVGLFATAALLVISVVVVFLVFAIAHMLSAIQEINLNRESIEKNVKCVMEISLGITNMLFFGEMKRPKKADEPWYKPLLDYGVGLGVAVVQVVGAVLSIAYLALMVVGILLILALAGMLRAIQEIELRPDKITDQIKNVFDCCRAALNACMGIGQETATTEESDKSWLGNLISYIGENVGGVFVTMVSVVQAILAIAYVALMAVAILLILVLAGILRTIQEISLKPETINETVKNVFDCCRAALNACMGIGQETATTEESDKSWLGNLISYIGENVGGVMTTMISILQAILAIAYVALMVVAMLLILALAGILRLLQEIELKDELIKGNVKTCITTCTYINELISGQNSQKAGGGSDGFWTTIMEWGSSLVGNIGAIISALMNIMFIALSIVNVFLIMILFGELKLLNEVALDDKRVKGNVKTCITTATYINDLLADARAKKKEKNKEGGFLGFLKNMFPGVAAVAEFISNYAFLSSAISSIGLIMILFEKLKELNSVALDGNRIKNNVNIVVSTASWLEYKLYEVTHYTSGDSRGEEKDLIVKGVDTFGYWIDRAYRPMVNNLYDLHSLLKGLVTRGLSEADRKSIETNVQSIIDMATNITNYIANKNFDASKAHQNVSLFERLGRVLKSFDSISSEGVKNSKEMVENCVEMLDRIDTMNFQKLDKAATMFKAFAVLAHSIKGNFDGLANTINENIMPVLEETQDLLKKLPAELEEAGIRMSNSMNSAVSRLQSSLTNAMDKYQQRVEEVINPTESNVTNSNSNTDDTNSVADSNTPEYKKKTYDKVKEMWKYEGLQDIVDILTGHAEHGGNGLKVQKTW